MEPTTEQACKRSRTDLESEPTDCCTQTTCTEETPHCEIKDIPEKETCCLATMDQCCQIFQWMDCNMTSSTITEIFGSIKTKEEPETSETKENLCPTYETWLACEKNIIRFWDTMEGTHRQMLFDHYNAQCKK